MFWEWLAKAVETAFLWAFARAYQIYSLFWRLETVGDPTPASAPLVYAHWHGDELLLISAFSRRRLAVMASRSRDGERLTTVLETMGYDVTRGSSSKGGAGGLKGLIDAVEHRGLSAALAVDGPRGPIYKVKPGILKLAQATGRPILPGAASADRAFVFKKAWNRCYLPYPFSRCVIVYGELIWVPQSLSEAEFEEKRMELERQLISLKAEAEKRTYRSAVQLVSQPL